ncbi:MAG: metallophosphoesterase [Candidatus Geothermarchaeales archaeon]
MGDVPTQTGDEVRNEIAKRGRRLTKDALDLLQSTAGDEDLTALLETILEESESVFITRDDIARALEKPIAPEISTETVASARVFEAEAKGISSRIRVLDDPGKKATRGDSLDDYVSLFKDRYKRLVEMVANRLGLDELEGVAPGLQLQLGDTVMVAGLVSNKRIRKTGMWIDLEDPQNKLSAFVSQRTAEVYALARQMPLDCVVAAKIRRVRVTLNMVDELYLPDLGVAKPNRSEREVYAVLTSDLHVGSKLFLKDVFMRFVFWLNGKYGNEKLQQLASKVKYVVIAGDLIDGVGIYPYQDQEIEEVSIERQYEKVAALLEQIPDYIEIVILPGNHDATRQALPQPPILSEYAQSLYERGTYHMVGNPVNVALHDVNLYAFHGRSLDDCMSTMPGIRQNNNAEALRMLLRARHIAPTFGLKTKIAPQRSDALIIQRPPDILQAGHIHINHHLYYNNRLVLNSGAWQGQTLYQRELGWEPTPGLAPLVDLSSLELRILDFISS